MMKCFDCKFYVVTETPTEVKELDIDYGGECHRHAPRPSIDEEWFWPVVDGDDFCGEYETKDNSKLTKPWREVPAHYYKKEGEDESESK